MSDAQKSHSGSLPPLPANIPADVEALNAKQYQCIVALKAALGEVLAFQSAPTTPTIHDYGRWRRLVDNDTTPEPAQAVDAVRVTALKRAAEDAVNAMNPRHGPFIDAVANPLLIIELCEALQASRQPETQQAGAEGAGEVRGPWTHADTARIDALARPGWELSQNNDPECRPEELWQVHRVSGGRNDREWTLIGQGETPRAAIDAALATKEANNG